MWKLFSSCWFFLFLILSLILSQGCGFVKYSHRDMALAAINALNGIYTMRVSIVCYLKNVRPSLLLLEYTGL